MPNLRRNWTVADLADLPNDGNRYEVLDGDLYVTPAPSLHHQAAVFLLARLLADYLQNERIGFVVIAPADVTFSPRRGVQPDLFVIPPHHGRYPARFEDVGHLLLAAEVVSSSSGRADRVSKRTVYREEGVEVYWVVDLDARTFELSVPAHPAVDVLAERLEWHPPGASRPCWTSKSISGECSTTNPFGATTSSIHVRSA